MNRVDVNVDVNPPSETKTTPSQGPFSYLKSGAGGQIRTADTAIFSRVQQVQRDRSVSDFRPLSSVVVALGLSTGLSTGLSVC